MMNTKMYTFIRGAGVVLLALAAAGVFGMIWLAPAVGNIMGTMIVTLETGFGGATWSQDSRYLKFVIEDWDRNEVYIVDATGKNLRLAESFPDDDISWSDEQYSSRTVSETAYGEGFLAPNGQVMMVKTRSLLQIIRVEDGKILFQGVPGDVRGAMYKQQVQVGALSCVGIVGAAGILLFVFGAVMLRRAAAQINFIK